MKRWVLLALFCICSSSLTAQEAVDDSTEVSSWRFEYHAMLGYSRIMEIEGHDQPAVGTISRAGGVGLGIEYRLCSYLSLYGGFISDNRGGVAWVDDTPFELSESQIVIPLMLRMQSWDSVVLGFDPGSPPGVGLEIGFGAFYGLILNQEAKELPGVENPLARNTNLEALDYHRIGIVGEIRLRMRLSMRTEVCVGIHMLQDLDTFGYTGSDSIIPMFGVDRISIAFSRPL